MKKNLQAIAALTLQALFVPHAMASFGCDNGPTLEGEFLVCQIGYNFDNGGTIEQDTLGLVKNIRADITLRIPATLEKLTTIFFQREVFLPGQQLDVSVQLDQTLPARITASPRLIMDSGVQSVCGLRFSSINLAGLSLKLKTHYNDYTKY